MILKTVHLLFRKLSANIIVILRHTEDSYLCVFWWDVHRPHFRMGVDRHF